MYKSISAFDRLSCYFTNATSLRCKINELQLLASTSKPYIMAITEIQFSESSSVTLLAIMFIDDTELVIPGVSVYLFAVIFTHVRSAIGFLLTQLWNKSGVQLRYAMKESLQAVYIYRTQTHRTQTCLIHSLGQTASRTNAFLLSDANS